MLQKNILSPITSNVNIYENKIEIEARNEIASEITKDYLDEAAFLKDGRKEPKS